MRAAGESDGCDQERCTFQHSGERCRKEHAVLYGGRWLQAFVHHAERAVVFLDAAGICIILVKRDAPINLVPDNHGGVIMPPPSHTTSTRLHLSICALMASRSPSRRTGRVACSTALAPISMIPMAPCWSLSI
jgi:hypothetical protein